MTPASFAPSENRGLFALKKFVYVIPYPVVSTIIFYIVIILKEDFPLLFGKRFDPIWGSIETTVLLLLFTLVYYRTPVQKMICIRFSATWLLLLPSTFVILNLYHDVRFCLINFNYLTLFIVIANFNTGIIEELVFRGFSFLGPVEKFPKIIVILTSVLFATCHLTYFERSWHEGVSELIIAFIIGLEFGVIRIATGSFVSCAIMHAMIDISGAFGQSFPVNTNDVSNALLNGSTLLANLILSVLAVFILPAMTAAKS